MNVLARPGPGFDPGWLALREPADQVARAGSLVYRLRPYLSPPLVVHDLGSGTGSMARWLAPRLPGPQRWVLHDVDAALLALAAGGCAGLRDAGGQPVQVRTRVTDVAGLRAADLAGGSLVTASALLDLLSRDEVDGLAAACATAGCPALLTLSVVGRVELDPPDGLDAALGKAFDDHQRRTVAGRALLGPDAAATAVRAFERRGMPVLTADSPWRLGPDRADLLARWLRGRVAAAAEQEPALRPAARGYLAGRLRAGGGLSAVVHHRDLLALPRGSGPA